MYLRYLKLAERLSAHMKSTLTWSRSPHSCQPQDAGARGAVSLLTTARSSQIPRSPFALTSGSKAMEPSGSVAASSLHRPIRAWATCTHLHGQRFGPRTSGHRSQGSGGPGRVQIKKLDRDEQVVFGEAYAPSFPDSQGDTMSADEIRRWRTTSCERARCRTSTPTIRRSRRVICGRKLHRS